MAGNFMNGQARTAIRAPSSFGEIDSPNYLNQSLSQRVKKFQTSYSCLPIRKINGFLLPPKQDNYFSLNKILDPYPITKPFRELALDVTQKRG
jgi:hypothetical protein